MSAAFYFHLATPAGEGGIAVFDLYGEGAAAALSRVFRPRSSTASRPPRGLLPEEGCMRLGEFAGPDGGVVDEAVLTRVSASASWSRLPAWTLSVHAGPWVQEKTASVLCALGGCSLDLRGVLLLARKACTMDALEAAAYERLIDARTDRAMRFFLRQHSGELSACLKDVLQLAEAGRLNESLGALARLVEGSRPALRLWQPLRMLLAGRPNAGKSTLFNRLVEDERAVVTEVPGTTRDTLEEFISAAGYPVVVADSAGLRPIEDVGPVEREGILQVHERDDDAVLYLLQYPWRLSEEDREFLSRRDPERIQVVASFADLASGSAAPPGMMAISALTGEGIVALRASIVSRWIDARGMESHETPCAPFSERQIEALSRPLLTAEIDSARALDAVRSAAIECLDFSWP